VSFSAAEISPSVSNSTLLTLALLALPGIGPAYYWKIVDHFGSPQAFANANNGDIEKSLKAEALSLWRGFLNNPSNSILGQVLQADLELAEQQGCQILTCEAGYPRLLKEISAPPPRLYIKGAVKGDSRCLELPQLAIVGSRRPSPVGLNNAQAFSRSLVEQGFVVTSGLAMGIDGAAHKGAVVAGGKTVAVLGTGLNTIYPQRHRGLAEEIVATGGLLVSEFPMAVAPHPSNFPRRNRIISGLSLGVLVVEAASKSGSLITARFAVEQGREVFALPGSMHCPVSRGCNELIRQGATLVQSTEDIVQELQAMLALKVEQLPPALSINSPLSITPPQPIISSLKQNIPKPVSVESTGIKSTPVNDFAQCLLDKLGYDVTSVDLLQQRLGGSVEVLLSELMALELEGIVMQVPGGYQRMAVD